MIRTQEQDFAMHDTVKRSTCAFSGNPHLPFGVFLVRFDKIVLSTMLQL